MSGNRSKAPFSKGVGHFERKFQREGGIAHQPLLVSEDWSDCRFVWYQNIHSALFSFVTIHASDRRTDRWTDRIPRAIPCVACIHAVARQKLEAKKLHLFAFSTTSRLNGECLLNDT